MKKKKALLWSMGYSLFTQLLLIQDIANTGNWERRPFNAAVFGGCSILGCGLGWLISLCLYRTKPKRLIKIKKKRSRFTPDQLLKELEQRQN